MKRVSGCWSAGWKIKRVEEIKQGQEIVDGKLVQPR